MRGAGLPRRSRSIESYLWETRALAVAALLALGQAATVITGALGLPFHAAAALPSRVWPADACPLCEDGTPVDRPLPAGG